MTTLRTPDAKTGLGDLDSRAPGDEVNLEEDAKTLPLEKRRAQDPEGKFEWKGGELRCPVRRHDYRLFIFKAPAPAVKG